jgi:catechol 2,3-dioxygenase-like lactoylglutathione lyase family enzyme
MRAKAVNANTYPPYIGRWLGEMLIVKRSHAPTGLEWVEARVANYEEMKRFYVKTLGLPLNFEEERKDFIQFKVGSSKTYLALLDVKRTGMTRAKGFVPTFEVRSLDQFIRSMKRKGVRVGRHVIEGDHVRLVDFLDPNGNLLQAFEWKRKSH